MQKQIWLLSCCVVCLYASQAASTSLTIDNLTPPLPIVGEPVSVHYSLTGDPVPGGVVYVTTEETETCESPIDNGSGQCSLTFSASGTKVVMAAYCGDDHFCFIAPPVQLNVAPTGTGTISIDNVSPPLPIVGEAVNIHYLVAGESSLDGIVYVTTEGSETCESSIADGSGGCSLTFSTSGTHVLMAAYCANNNCILSEPRPITVYPIAASQVDLSVSITNGTSFLRGGFPTTYLITVRNEGATDASNATVTDLIPSTLKDAIWTCVPTGGAVCASTGVGDIADVIDVPVGATAIYQLVVTVQSAPEDAVVNEVNVATSDADVDVNQSNNTAIDTDLVGIFADPFEER